MIMKKVDNELTEETNAMYKTKNLIKQFNAEDISKNKKELYKKIYSFKTTPSAVTSN